MNVLYITRKYPPSKGGMQAMNYSLAEDLSGKVRLRKITWGGSQVYLPIFMLSAYIRAFSALGKKETDVLILGDAVLAPLGAALKKRFNVKTVCIAHGLDVVFPLRAYQRIVSRALGELDAVICVSRKTQEECVKRGLKNTAVIPNGVNIPCPDGTKEVPGFDAGKKKVILSVGRLVKRKGIAEFIKNVIPKLCALRDDFVYVVVGDGKEKKNICSLVEALGLNDRVRLIGKCDDAALEKFYRGADIFVMPNIPVAGDMEGFGIVALEASSYGIPVVASDIEGIRDAVSESKNGFLLPSGDSGLFVNKIDHLLGDENARRAFSESARRYVNDNFRWDIIGERYLRVFRQLTGVR